jgi:outer membrane protease
MKHIAKSIASFAFFVIILFLAIPSARADISLFGKPYEFTLSGGPGFMYGTSYEIVYKNSVSNRYMSELQWNIKPLLFFGLDIDFGPQEPLEHWGFFAGLGIKAGLPMVTGIIEDRDWLEPTTVPGSLTLFSSHENHTKAAFLANLNTGLSLPVQKFMFKFYLNFDYMYFSWEARDGYTQYDKNIRAKGDNTPYVPWDSGFQKNYANALGLGISYVQHWFLFSTGIGGKLPLGRFTLSADVFLGIPVCIGIDDHHKRRIRFTDYLYRGLLIKPQLGVSFAISDHFDIGLSAAYWYIGETRGDTYQQNQGGGGYWAKVREPGGASFKAFEGMLALTYHPSSKKQGRAVINR